MPQARRGPLACLPRFRRAVRAHDFNSNALTRRVVHPGSRVAEVFGTGIVVVTADGGESVVSMGSLAPYSRPSMTWPLFSRLRTSTWVFASLCSILLFACSESSSSTGDVDAPGGADAPGGELLALACSDLLGSVYEGQAPPGNWSAAMRGDVTRCVFERVVPIEEMEEAFAVQESFIDPGLSTPVFKYRIQYWTERNEGEPVLVKFAGIEFARTDLGGAAWVGAANCHNPS